MGWLEWEEGVFRGLLSLWRRLRPPTTTHSPDAARPDPCLAAFAGALAGRPVRLIPSTGAGGLRGDELLLPPIDLSAPGLPASAAQNREAMLIRVAVQATALRLDPGLCDPRRLPADPAARAALAARAFRAAARHLAADLPGFADLHRRAAPLETLRHPADARAALAAALDLDTADPPPDPTRPDAPPGPIPEPLIWGGLLPAAEGHAATPGAEPERAPSTGTERQGRAADTVERIAPDEDRARESVLQHTFEKVETLEEHQGQIRRMDGSDELDDHLEALDSLDLSRVIRGGEQARSLYRADIGAPGEIPDVGDVAAGEVGISYPEWDVRRSAYRPGWCTVYPTPMGAGDPVWAADHAPALRPTIDALHRELLRHRSRRRVVTAQRDGDDLDLDAVIDDMAARRAGCPGERLFLRRVRDTRDFAATILLDISLSSDAIIGDRRVLDMAREAVLVIGEVADRLGDALQVLAFASNTRNRCRVWTVRDWREPWAAGRARLGALRPQGYTRIGPALRHAAAGLARQGAAQRLLLLVSDGKPTDYDRYEGRYGVADIRQALREAGREGICTRALALDAAARDHLPEMLGPGAWRAVCRPDQLLPALTALYGAHLRIGS